MPEQAYDEEFIDGVRVRRVVRTVSDAEIARRDAPMRLRAVVATLAQWAADEQATAAAWPGLTAGQKDAANRQMHQRWGTFLERFGDLLVALSLD